MSAQYIQGSTINKYSLSICQWDKNKLKRGCVLYFGTIYQKVFFINGMCTMHDKLVLHFSLPWCKLWSIMLNNNNNNIDSATLTSSVDMPFVSFTSSFNKSFILNKF